MKNIIVLFLVLTLACCEVIEKHLDIPASLKMTNVALLTRVDRVINLNYSYVLDGRHIWSQYPDMNLLIDLPFDQYV